MTTTRDPNVEALIAAAQEVETQMFEAHIRSIDPGNADERLLPHTENTWWGSSELRPRYRDRWTQGLWVGWKAKADSLLRVAKP